MLWFADISVVRFLSNIGLAPWVWKRCNKVAGYKKLQYPLPLGAGEDETDPFNASKSSFDRHPPWWHLGAAGGAHV